MQAITRWEIRSIPAVGKASAWDVPVMNYQELDINGSKVIRDPTDQLHFLMNLVQSGRLFFYQESGVVYSVHATGFEWMPESLATGGTWLARHFHANRRRNSVRTNHGYQEL